jgi:NhaA family Na+:H+ antiporter
VSLLRSARFPAVVLLCAAIAALLVANSPLGPGVVEIKQTYVGIPGIFEMSVGHWVQDGLLAVFFFMVAVELQFELTNGELNSARKALQPAIAAAGGVLVPIAVFLAFAFGTDSVRGWPIPTATDIAFALGVLAVFGKGLPSGIRIFLLALAILDDIVGIVFIAVLFTTDVNLGLLALAALAVVVFGVLSRQLDTRARVPIAVLLVIVGIATWVLVYESGVHATIAGVALGLAMSQRPALHVRHALEPWVNGFVLPLFAFSAALAV